MILMIAVIVLLVLGFWFDHRITEMQRFTDHQSKKITDLQNALEVSDRKLLLYRDNIFFDGEDFRVTYKSSRFTTKLDFHRKLSGILEEPWAITLPPATRRLTDELFWVVNGWTIIDLDGNHVWETKT